MEPKYPIYVLGRIPSAQQKALEKAGFHCLQLKSSSEWESAKKMAPTALFVTAESVPTGGDPAKEVAIHQREEFLSVCAHDLRSPIGLVQSCLRMILSGKPALTSEQLELLTRAERQATQAIQLVNDLLDVTVYEQGLKPEYHLVSLSEFLSEFHRDYRQKAEEKGIEFRFENAVPGWKVLIDSDRIRQLLQNLVTNAIKFTDTGKSVVLSVKSFQGRRRNDPPYPMIILSLKDEGRGIPQAELQRIFDKFTQMKSQSRSEGRGLGLTVAKQISALHDGNLWVESKEGAGTTFHVLIPHVISYVEFAERPQLVLVAEPDEGRRTLFFEPLRKWGYTILYVKDGVEALTHLAYHQPAALIVGSELEKMPISEVMSTIKSDAVLSRIPVIYSSENGLIPKGKFDATLKLPLTQENLQKIIGTLKAA